MSGGTLSRFFLLLYLLGSSVTGVRLFHVFLKDEKNIGDVFSSPLRYFEELKNVTVLVICVDADTPEVIATIADLRRDDITIIGGGGLLDHSDRWNFAIKYYCEITTCILWAPGRNRHHSHTGRSFTHTLEEILGSVAVGRTRDFNHKDEVAPLLDPSCMIPELQRSCVKTRGVGYYLHAKLSQLRSEEVEFMLRNVSPEDVLFNNELNISIVMDFLCRHEVIVTSSYHGVLWSTYMNIPVYTVFDFSEKFTHLPFTPRAYLTEELQQPLSTVPYVDGITVMGDCIQANTLFYTTYIEPFVKTLKKLSFPQAHTSRINTAYNNRISNFNLRKVISLVSAECTPLNRNHIYDRLSSPLFEVNLKIEIELRFAKFLLWIHDHQMLSGEVQQEENLGIYIMIRSGLQSEPFQFVDFTDYVLKTVKSIRRILDKPSYDYKSNQFQSEVTVMLGLIDLEPSLKYALKAVALSDLEIDRLSSDMSDDSVNVNKLRSELLDDGLFEIEC